MEEYTHTIKRQGAGWAIVGIDESYASLQEAWDEARHDLLHVGGGRIVVVDRHGRVRAAETVAVHDLGHAN
jgi:hypothetical protein